MSHNTLCFRIWSSIHKDYVGDVAQIAWNGTEHNIILPNYRDFRLERFSGHLDSAGVKIFEGDRIAFKDDNGEYKNGIVRFDETVFNANPSWHVRFNGLHDYQTMAEVINQFDVTVIGNVHQGIK